MQKSNIYIKIKGKTPDTFKITTGYILFDDQENISIQPVEVESVSDFIMASAQSFKVIDVIIHGMWASFTPAWNDMMSKMSQIFHRSPEGEESTLTISIIWDCALLYKNSIRIAAEKGQVLTGLITPIFQKGKSVNFVTHSMGNRVFRSFYMHLEDIETYHIARWFAVSADLSKLEFEQDFLSKHKNIDKIYVYKHESDLIIKISQLINKDERLGVYGSEEEDIHVQVIDGSQFDSDTDFITRLVKHRYFYESKDARDMLLKQLEQ